ncbi:hypothetical protein EYF80_008563 [Liparis tanakae]|uniref:Uncharacterized protein n=1 Tax=Liparis tanakae TaxID=230148 RepID=A0A4Z2IT94_9TELE|nr:hypothetical protein EYF80_008563 [Liparis tanakae]
MPAERRRWVLWALPTSHPGKWFGLSEIRAWRAFHQTPAEMGCGERDRLLFRLRNRGDGIWRGPSWAGGGWYSRTPALFLLQCISCNAMALQVWRNEGRDLSRAAVNHLAAKNARIGRIMWNNPIVKSLPHSLLQLVAQRKMVLFIRCLSGGSLLQLHTERD